MDFNCVYPLGLSLLFACLRLMMVHGSFLIIHFSFVFLPTTPPATKSSKIVRQIIYLRVQLVGITVSLDCRLCSISTNKTSQNTTPTIASEQSQAAAPTNNNINMNEVTSLLSQRYLTSNTQLIKKHIIKILLYQPFHQ